MTRFFPIDNEELDKTKNIRYIQDILYSWQGEDNLVTRFDIKSSKIYHSFEKTNQPDIFNGTLRVWTKKEIIRILKKLQSSQKTVHLNIFEKFDLLEKVFNRRGKRLIEMTDKEKEAACTNSIENARLSLEHADYNMAAYFSKAALMYKNSPEAERILVECRKNIGFQSVA